MSFLHLEGRYSLAQILLGKILTALPTSFYNANRGRSIAVDQPTSPRIF